MHKLYLRTTESIYLEWVNDFLTTEYMAEYYDIMVEELEDLIKQGREEYNLNKGI